MIKTRLTLGVCLCIGLLACLMHPLTSNLSPSNLRRSNPGLIREGFLVKEFASWNGVLNLVNYDRIGLGRLSAQPRDYISKLADGVRGSFEDFPGSFLLFDGALAEIVVKIPVWQNLSNLKFSAIELVSQKPSYVQLTHRANSGLTRRIPLSRRVLSRKGKVLIVEYSTAPENAQLDEGAAIVSYFNNSLEFVFIDEIVLDNLSDRRDPAFNFSGDLGKWREAFEASEYERVRDKFEQRNSDEKELLGLLIGYPSSHFDTKAIFVQETRTGEGDSIYSLLFQVDQTGSPILDVTRAYVVVPKVASGRFPVIVLCHQGTVYGADEPMGFLGRAELSLAGELARNGVASLVVESFYRNGLPENGSVVYSHHPHWSVAGKEIENVSRCLTFVLSKTFEKMSGGKFDPARIGISGFSYGAFNSLLCALMDSRFSLVAMAHLENYSKDWDNFAEALYIPQLCFLRKEKHYPLHVSRMLRLLSPKHVLATVGDEGLAKHYREHLDPTVEKIRVLNNPIGKVFTFSERAVFLDFIYQSFGIQAKAEQIGPTYSLDGDSTKYLARENRWRSLLVQALRD